MCFYIYILYMYFLHIFMLICNFGSVCLYQIPWKNPNPNVYFNSVDSVQFLIELSKL